MQSHADHSARKSGSLTIVGLGPGRIEYMTGRSVEAIRDAEYIIGNDSYLSPLESLLGGKNIIRSSMGKEVDRAKQAIDLAQHHSVAIVSGGDAGVYGMASIVLEIAEREKANIHIEIIPGVTAANAAASRVGSPLSGDFAVISLSDLLTPLEVIEKRLDAVFSAGIPVVLYNPKSKGRPHNFALAMEHARLYHKPETPVAIVKNALREGEKVIITTLGQVAHHDDDVDMHTTVIIGGDETRIWKEGHYVKGIITPRGYHRKYLY